MCVCVCVCVWRLSWLILYVGLIAADTLVITVICWKSSVFVSCNVVMLFFLFFLYGLSMLCLAFLAVPFFRKAEHAQNVMTLLVLVFGSLYMAVSYTRDYSHKDGPVSSVPLWCQWLLALLSPVAFTLALDQVPYHLLLVVPVWAPGRYCSPFHLLIFVLFKLFVCLLNFLPYFLYFLHFFSLLIYFFTHLLPDISTSSEIGPLFFQARDGRRWPNLALVFWCVNFCHSIFCYWCVFAFVVFDLVYQY